MADLIQYEGGAVMASLEDRTITGLLVPYNEVGRTNMGRFQVEAGAIALPADPAVVGLNTDHIRHAGVGRAVSLEERLDGDAPGIYATLYVARTPEGDAALADAVDPNGRRRKLSAEFGPAMIRAGKLVAGHAKLWGAALVEAGAFPSAQVLAADTPDEAAAAVETADPASLETVATAHTHDTREAQPPGECPACDAVFPPPADTTPTDPAAPADGDTTAQKDVTAMALPNTLNLEPAATTAPRTPALHDIYAAIAGYRANPNAGDAAQVLAALTDIKLTGTGSLPASGVLQENWVGQLYQGIEYVRQYLPLGTTGTDISAAGKKGYRINRGTLSTPKNDNLDISDWAGNKTQIGSGNAFTQTAASVLHRFALGNDIGREFYDLPGGLDVIEAFLRLVVEDHLMWSDEKARQAWIAAAGTPVAPNTYPEKYAGNVAIGQLIQGILRVKAKKADGRRDKPTFAILNDAAFEDLVYTPKDLIPEYIKFGVSTDGTGTADGDVVVTNGDIGIESTPAVLVGAGKAITFDELAGGPLWVDALEVAKGGIDKALHGYLQVFRQRDEAVTIIGTPDA